MQKWIFGQEIMCSGSCSYRILLSSQGLVLYHKAIMYFWWVDLGQLPTAHPTTLLLPLLNRLEAENEMEKCSSLSESAAVAICRFSKQPGWPYIKHTKTQSRQMARCANKHRDQGLYQHPHKHHEHMHRHEKHRWLNPAPPFQMIRIEVSLWSYILLSVFSN